MFDSPVLGIPEYDALGSVRLSLGRFNTRQEIDIAATELIKTWKKLM
jgi:cysteine sulfinate desulfinase/cysteine desulfurase-like protein